MTDDSHQNPARTDLLPDKPAMARPETFRGWLKAAGQVCRAIARHSMFQMSVGNNVLAFGRGGPISGFISLVGTALIAFTIARQEITGKDRGMPYYSLAAINMLSGAAALASNPVAAASLFVWGVGHAFRGYQFPRGIKPREFWKTPIFYTGIADIMAGLLLVPYSVPLAAVAMGVAATGAALTLRRAATDQGKERRITSTRILAGGWALQSLGFLLASGPIHSVVTCALYALALVSMEREEKASQRLGAAQRATQLPSPKA